MTTEQADKLLTCLEQIKQCLIVQVEYETGNKIEFTKKEVEHDVAKTKKRKK